MGGSAPSTVGAAFDALREESTPSSYSATLAFSCSSASSSAWPAASTSACELAAAARSAAKPSARMSLARRATPALRDAGAAVRGGRGQLHARAMRRRGTTPPMNAIQCNDAPEATAEETAARARTSQACTSLAALPAWPACRIKCCSSAVGPPRVAGPALAQRVASCRQMLLASPVPCCPPSDMSTSTVACSNACFDPRGLSHAAARRANTASGTRAWPALAALRAAATSTGACTCSCIYAAPVWSAGAHNASARVRLT